MTSASFLAHLLNALASASSLFLVAAGLSLIFGVTRIVNFAHGSFYMVGLYLGVTLAEALTARFGPVGFWLAIPLAALGVGLLGAVVEFVVLKRIERAPELFQLLATFALVLLIKDAALALWGPEDLLGPRAPGFWREAFDWQGQRVPRYDVLLIAAGPAVLVALHLLSTRTRFGLLVRAATQDRTMVGALGVDQRWLFTAVFALGAALAGLGGALQVPREPANLGLDLAVIGDAFVVVVVGGMGSIPGAALAALLIAGVKAVVVAIGSVEWNGVTYNVTKLTLVVEFAVMAAVLIARPWGLRGRPMRTAHDASLGEHPFRPAPRSAVMAVLVGLALLAALPALVDARSYALVMGIEVATAVLFAASLHLLIGPAGVHSFGHAASFGLGAYAAALWVTKGGGTLAGALLVGPAVAAAGAALVALVGARLSGTYFAMLTLAFAQIVWAVVYQWDDVTGGSNGVTGVWPPEALSDARRWYGVVVPIVVVAVFALRRLVMSPWGQALRAARDAPARAEASGLPVARLKAVAFVVAGAFAGLAGALYAFSKGSISPEVLSVAKSVDGLVMVLLGGVHTLAGPVVGAALFTWLADTLARTTDYWRALLGGVMLLLVIAFPDGVVGFGRTLWARWTARRRPAEAAHGT